MSWISSIIKPKIKINTGARRAQNTAGLWIKCKECGQALFEKELERHRYVCHQCDHHFRISAEQRIDFTLDKEGREELFPALYPTDPLKFKDIKPYRVRVKEAQRKTGSNDAVRVVKGKIKGVPAVVAAFEFGFLGGSMGSVVGAKIAHGALAAAKAGCGYVVFPASGGARMQEGILSLMQMAKTSAALTKLDEMGLPFIPVLTDPTTGGVTASFAMLGDIILAEPNALICFAGPRVIEQTVREKLPEGFQRSEYLLEHGFLDAICHRHDLKDTLSDILSRLTGFKVPKMAENLDTMDTAAPPEAAMPVVSPTNKGS